MKMDPGLDTLEFTFPHGKADPRSPQKPVLVGVVGSGNLEVLIEPLAGTDCHVRVHTSARGFASTWAAVVTDFHARHGLSGARVEINDMGATPAVVSLRLDQAVASFRGQ